MQNYPNCSLTNFFKNCLTPEGELYGCYPNNNGNIGLCLPLTYSLPYNIFPQTKYVDISTTKQSVLFSALVTSFLYVMFSIEFYMNALELSFQTRIEGVSTLFYSEESFMKASKYIIISITFSFAYVIAMTIDSFNFYYLNGDDTVSKWSFIVNCWFLFGQITLKAMYEKEIIQDLNMYLSLTDCAMHGYLDNYFFYSKSKEVRNLNIKMKNLHAEYQEKRKTRGEPNDGGGENRKTSSMTLKQYKEEMNKITSEIKKLNTERLKIYKKDDSAMAEMMSYLNPVMFLILMILTIIFAFVPMSNGGTQTFSSFQLFILIFSGLGIYGLYVFPQLKNVILITGADEKKVAKSYNRIMSMAFLIMIVFGLFYVNYFNFYEVPYGVLFLINSFLLFTTTLTSCDKLAKLRKVNSFKKEKKMWWNCFDFF